MGDRSQETGEIRLEAGIWKLESGMGGRTTSFQLLASNFFYPATIAHFFEKWFDRLAALAGFVALDGLVAFDALVALGWGSVLECLVVPEMESGDRRQETGDRRQETGVGIFETRGRKSARRKRVAWASRPWSGGFATPRNEGRNGMLSCNARPLNGPPIRGWNLEVGIWNGWSDYELPASSFQLLSSRHYSTFFRKVV